MPPSHRIVKKDSIENRRARGEISCAECRRHKLRCDRAIPCGTCVRKGCQKICPNGTLAPTHGAKSSGPAANSSDAKLTEMSKRIRQLEDALQVSHSTVSGTPHPLLAEDLLQIKRGATLPTTEKDEDPADTNLIESFGTLAVTTAGTEVYYGDTQHDLFAHKVAAVAAVAASEIDAQSASPVSLPPHVSYLSKTFPFTPLYLPVEQIQESIEGMLPPFTRATALVEAYLQNLSWFFRPLDREEIVEELIPMVYKRKHHPSHVGYAATSPSDSSGGQARMDLHVLALLLAIFAVGAVADMTLDPWNDEGELYYELSRTALSLKPVFEGAGLHAVETTALLGAYNLFSCRSKGMEGTWKILSFSLLLAASIGLNRDPAHFNLSPKIVQRRRRAFWELYSLDVLKTHATGRPMTFISRVIDCELPEDDDPLDYEGGTEKLDSIWQIRHRFMKDIVMESMDKLSVAHNIKYSEILALDQKIRQYDPQGILRLSVEESKIDEDGGVLPVLHRQWVLSVFKDSSLLFLHRNFLARAIIEDPENPVRTRFGPSFLSMYRAAASLVHFIRRHISKKSIFFSRCWPILAQALHATVVLGSVAACGTASSLAPQAFVHFTLGYEIFRKAPMHPVINALVPFLARLHEQAIEALEKHGHNISFKHSPIATSPAIKRSLSTDSYATEALGRSAKKSLNGEFGTASASMQTFGHHPGPSTTAQPSSSAAPQLSMPFTGIPEHYDESSPFAPLTDHNPANNEMNRMETDADSFQAAGASSGEAGQDSEHAVGPSNGGFDINVDQKPFTFESGNSGEQLFNPDLFDLSGSSTEDISDVFSTYTTFPDLMIDGSNVSGPSSGGIGDSAKAQPAPHAPALHADPFLYNSPSPGNFFTSDFDVSFDMRVSSGPESVLPLLPEDMEAWRTILQDSRFFGVGGENPEDGRATPTPR